MTTYLLTWNPEKWNWNDLADCVEKCAVNGSLVSRWSCGNTKKIKAGDRFFLLKQGKEPRGIIGSGTILSQPFQEKHWDGSGNPGLYVDIEFDSLLNPETDFILDREELNESPFSDMHWNTQSSGTTIPEPVAAALEKAWKDLLKERSLSLTLETNQETLKLRFNNANFWWVNHNQTFKDELEGGYIWSPKKNKNGATNQTYLNLPKTQISDIVFSFAGSEIKAIGVVKGKCRNSDRPASFGKTGEQWDKDGWLVPIDWVEITNTFRPKDYITEIASLLPEKNSPIQSNGNGNQGCYLAEISNELGLLLLGIAQTEDIAISDLVEETSVLIAEEEEVNQIEKQPITETEKEQIVKARIGQGLFKSRVEKIEKSCRLTNTTDRRFLIASHIKPWRISSNEEKLDGNNGLLLSPHVDKLFDKGWISFSDEGKVLCANAEIKKLMKAWNLDCEMNVGKFNSMQKEYLKYHRTNILKKEI